MSLALFSTKPSYYKNGIWWFTKMMSKAVGEERWDAMRMFRRVNAMKFYYHRQSVLCQVFCDWPEMANLIGIYPKIDQSHGFQHYATYEMYRDWQENTLQSDGSFAMYIYLFGGIYLIHLGYSFMIPFYWINTPLKNEEMVRLRMKDAAGSTVLEELYGQQYAEFAWSPHDFHYNRNRGMNGYMHPDDPRVMHTSSFNRKHKYREHYMTRVGDQHHMSKLG